MLFKGYMMTFSTCGDKQYEEIGAVWDYLSAEYGRESIRGLGFSWTDTSIDYCFGFVEDLSVEEYLKRLKNVNKFGDKHFRFNIIDIPDDEWIEFNGFTQSLSDLYSDVYKLRSPDYEIETFSEDGSCKVMVHYPPNPEDVLPELYKGLKIRENAAQIGIIVAGADIPILAMWIIWAIRRGYEFGFVNLGLPIVLAILVILVHLALLVIRQSYKQMFAASIIRLRLSPEKREEVARKYGVLDFVESMVKARHR